MCQSGLLTALSTSPCLGPSEHVEDEIVAPAEKVTEENDEVASAVVEEPDEASQEKEQLVEVVEKKVKDEIQLKMEAEAEKDAEEAEKAEKEAEEAEKEAAIKKMKAEKEAAIKEKEAAIKEKEAAEEVENTVSFEVHQCVGLCDMLLRLQGFESEIYPMGYEKCYVFLMLA